MWTPYFISIMTLLTLIGIYCRSILMQRQSMIWSKIIRFYRMYSTSWKLKRYCHLTSGSLMCQCSISGFSCLLFRGNTRFDELHEVNKIIDNNECYLFSKWSWSFLVSLLSHVPNFYNFFFTRLGPLIQGGTTNWGCPIWWES